MTIAHLDEAPSAELRVGHLDGRWTNLGAAAGSVNVGVRRIEVGAGGWSTPVHEHGRQEEIFYVLAGRGLSWQRGRTAPIRAGDCIVYRPRAGAHSIHATEPLDLLAFGPREYDEGLRLPRIGMSLLNGRALVSEPGAIDGRPFQFVREAEIGPPELGDGPGERPANVVNVDEVEPKRVDRPRIARARRDLARAAGSMTTGLQHTEVAPGRLSSPQHCHSLEEELFVVLDGDGVLLLDDDEHPVRAGTVVSRPPGTGIAHTFRAGEGGLTYLAYGTREPNDICFFPRSNKVALRGVGVIARVERLDLWDGED